MSEHHHDHEIEEYCMASSLDLFSKPPQQMGFESKRIQRFEPLSVYHSGQPLNFNIQNSSSEYLDPTSIKLILKLKIVNANGEDLGGPVAGANGQPAVLPNNSIAFPINNIASTMFREVVVSLNDKVISRSSYLYPFRAIFEKVLSFNKNCLKNNLKYSGFALDEGTIDDVSIALEGASTNTGAKYRFAISVPSKSFQVIDGVHTEICSQEKLLPPNTRLNFTFTRHVNDKFPIMGNAANGGYQLIIQNAFMEARVFTISDTIRESHMLTLQKNPYFIPVDNVEMRYFTFPLNSSDLSVQSIYKNAHITPRRVVFGLVEQRRFQGHYNLNPFKFENFNISQFTLRNNGQIVDQEISTDYGNDLYTEAYYRFLENAGLSEKGSIITIENYKSNCNLYAFDLTNINEASCNVLDPPTACDLSVQIKLRENTITSVVLIVYLEYDSFIKITRDRDIIVPNTE